MPAIPILLGNLAFVTRTTSAAYDRSLKGSPFVLDSEARLHIGPADDMARNEHGAILVVYELLLQAGGLEFTFGGVIRNRLRLLDAFDRFDAARLNEGDEGARVSIYGTYDGQMLAPFVDDDLPAGPCGRSVNELKWDLYQRCMRMDPEFSRRELSEAAKKQEGRFITRPRMT